MPRHSSPTLLDRHLLQRRRLRSRHLLQDAGFLLRHTGDALASRLSDITRSFPHALHIGGRDGTTFLKTLQDAAGSEWMVAMDLSPALVSAHSTAVCGDEEALPFACHSLDLITSNFGLHSINDLPGALVQMRHALRPDGLFLASMLGGETLRELRIALMEAEMLLSGGVRPRVMPFADKPQMGDLLSRAQFALPVVDSDIITVTYPDIFALMRDIRGMGEASIIGDQPKHFTRRSLFAAAQAVYEERFSESNGRLIASFEVIYLIGWAPHASQPQPLKPGTARTRLADALHTQEETL